MLVSDQAWAGYAVQSHLQAGRTADYQRTTLDVTLQATTAYLNVLRARAIATVQRANLKVTRSNLDLAVLRERTGAAVEVLTPDFLGDVAAIDRVIEARPEVYNHNLETVPRVHLQ